jgi:hypothetical protein
MGTALVPSLYRPENYFTQIDRLPHPKPQADPAFFDITAQHWQKLLPCRRQSSSQRNTLSGRGNLPAPCPSATRKLLITQWQELIDPAAWTDFQSHLH